MVGVYQLPEELGSVKIVIRNYYNGTLHVSWETQEDFGLGTKVTVSGDQISFQMETPEAMTVKLAVQKGHYSGTVCHGTEEIAVSGQVGPITAREDRIEKSTTKKRALIMYATITKNTEKIAKSFEESFRHYGWEVDLVRIVNQGRAPHDYSGYDVVCLGSPIIAGGPMMCVTKQFSLGGGTSLEENVAKNAEAGLDFNAGGVGLKGGPGGEKKPPEGPKPPAGAGPGKSEQGGARYAGGPAPHGVYQPLGIVFTTYGGGFYGSNEALATLEILKLYLELRSVKVVGRFGCCGREYGPAGVADGGKPMLMGGTIDPPVYYQDAEGLYHAGSFFFHTHMNDKPGERDLMKAKALVADLVEDYFYSHDGLRKDVASCYTTIS